jgi:cytochrome c peroxidase
VIGALLLAAAAELPLPPPGSYNLPVIDEVADHQVVESGGRATSLYALKQDRLAVVAFVYFSCNEREGCPLAMGVLHQLDQRLAAERELAGQVSLITISFDPARDTPAQLASVRELYRPRTDWRFVTTRGERQLGPILADFDQTVGKVRGDDGEWNGLFRHVLKVFVLDRRNRIRNIYSAGFLNAELVINDLKTVLRDPLE